jgi:hypothetical protein
LTTPARAKVFILVGTLKADLVHPKEFSKWWTSGICEATFGKGSQVGAKDALLAASQQPMQSLASWNKTTTTKQQQQ